MRDIGLTIFIFSLLPVIFARPFYGLVMFTWLAYMRAPDLCWGFAKNIRFSFIVAVVMFLGFFLNERKRFYRREIRNDLIVLLTGLVILSVIVNYILLGKAEGKYEEFAKIMLIAIFTVAIVDTQWKMRVMIWTIALSLGFYGAKCGIFGFLGGEVFQGPGGLLLDNNDFSLAMVMNLPFLFYLSMEEKDPRVRMFLRIVAVLTVATVVATHSRGGFLALAIVYFAITMKSKHKALGLSAAFVAAILFLLFIPAEYVERLKTITDLKETSAASRLLSWKTALAMIKSNPIFGVGLGNFLSENFRYAPIKEHILLRGFYKPHVAHNSYLQIWAESGTLAFIVFMSLLAVTLYKLRSLMKGSRREGGPSWITNYSTLFEVSIYGYLVGAVFLNRGQFDLVYQIVGLSAALTILSVEQRSRGIVRLDEKPVLTIRSKDEYIVPRRIT
jgi:probable O-glycosylation ligase (exosortase A-associated)